MDARATESIGRVAKVLQFRAPSTLSPEAKQVQEELRLRGLSPEQFAASYRAEYVLREGHGLDEQAIFRALEELA